MEINFGRNIGVGREALGLNVEGVQRGAADASDVERTKSDLTIGRQINAISTSEPTAPVPDDALRRDDDLGNLVKAAFNLPPPAMPDFVD